MQTACNRLTSSPTVVGEVFSYIRMNYLEIFLNALDATTYLEYYLIRKVSKCKEVQPWDSPKPLKPCPILCGGKFL